MFHVKHFTGVVHRAGDVERRLPRNGTGNDTCDRRTVKVFRVKHR